MTKITGWARQGLTERQIAHNMGIAYSTFNVWKNKHLELLEALKKGKEVVDFEVEAKLYQRAMGYEYEEVTETVEDKNGVITKRRQVHKRHAPADTTAIIFWLKNRMPTVWRNKVEFEDTGSLDKLDTILEGIVNVAKK